MSKGGKRAAHDGRGVIASTAADRDTAVARAAGDDHAWHYGTLRGLGAHEGGRSAEVVWDEGIQSSGGEHISDEAWAVLRLAFQTTRRIRVLSALPSPDWAFDFSEVHACSL